MWMRGTSYERGENFSENSKNDQNFSAFLCKDFIIPFCHAWSACALMQIQISVKVVAVPAFLDSYISLLESQIIYR